MYQIADATDYFYDVWNKLEIVRYDIAVVATMDIIIIFVQLPAIVWNLLEIDVVGKLSYFSNSLSGKAVMGQEFRLQLLSVGRDFEPR